MRTTLRTFGVCGRGALLGRSAWQGRRFHAIHNGPGAGGDLVAGLLSSCATAPASREDKAALVTEAASRWQQMRTADPALGALVQRGHGYALFPDVGKAGLGVGGAYGRGVVYERGQHIGYSDLTQGTVGAQVGGQSFSELLVFETKAALERFKAGRFGFAAEASAVVLKSGSLRTPTLSTAWRWWCNPLGG